MALQGPIQTNNNTMPQPRLHGSKLNKITKALRFAPNSDYCKQVVKWSIEEDRYNSVPPSSQIVSPSEVLMVCKHLNKVSGFESPIEAKKDRKPFIFIAAIIILFILAFILVPLGEPFIFVSYLLVALIILTTVIFLFYFLVVRERYLEKRARLFRLEASRLNRDYFLPKGVELCIGLLAAWLEFRNVQTYRTMVT